MKTYQELTNVQKELYDDLTDTDNILSDNLYRHEVMEVMELMASEYDEEDVEPNPFGRGSEGEPTLYFLLNDKQKALYGHITMELDEFEDGFTLEEVKEVYAALIQDPEVVDFTS